MGMGKPMPAASGKASAAKAFVPKYEYFEKAKLAAYPNEEGGCLYLDKGQDEKQFFALNNIAKSRSGSNEELCRRIGMGVSLDANSAAAGVKLLEKHFSGEWPVAVQTSLHKTGLPKLKAALETTQGKQFVAALDILNVGKEGRPEEADIKKALKGFVDYLQKDPDNVQVPLARLAADASCLYLFAMSLLKDMALVQHPKEWAKKMEGKQSEAVKAWIRRPTDVEKRHW